MTTTKALLIDDEPDILDLLELTLTRMGVHCVTAENVADAKQRLTSDNFDFCLTDMRLPDGDGLEIVEFVQENCPDTPIAMLTAHGNMETAILAMKAGAFDFVSKPVQLETLRKLVTSAVKTKHTEPDSKELESNISFIGATEPMKNLQRTISKVARSQAPVHVAGESGTGKELVSRLIHDIGPRRDKPFVPVNCGAIPSELMESEFFGHKKGSFTGAVSDKQGLFQAADGGTLFLDEVADLPLTMQVKLLRAIQEKAVRPVGSEKEIAVDVRILSATHKPLHRMVQAGEFRQDLFYRINVIEVQVPPLRDRREDIPDLAQHILSKLAEGESQNKPQLSKAALNALLSYPFPGNIRELENILERAMTLSVDDTIEPEDLMLPRQESDETTALPNDDGKATIASPTDSSMEAVTTQSAEETEVVAGKRGDTPLEEYLEALERQAVIEALEATRWNKTEAAKLLGITFRAIRYRMKKLGLE